MPYRAPGTFHAGPPHGSIRNGSVINTGKDASYSLRDSERSAARPYLKALTTFQHWAKLDATIAQSPIPPNPYPGIEAARRNAGIMG